MQMNAPLSSMGPADMVPCLELSVTAHTAWKLSKDNKLSKYDPQRGSFSYSYCKVQRTVVVPSGLPTTLSLSQIFQAHSALYGVPPA